MIELYPVAISGTGVTIPGAEDNAYIGEMSFEVVTQWLVMYTQDPADKSWWMLQGLMTQKSCRICMSAPGLYSGSSSDPTSEAKTLNPPFGPAAVGDILSENTYNNWALQGHYTRRDERYKDAKYSTVWVCFGKPKINQKTLFKMKLTDDPTTTIPVA